MLRAPGSLKLETPFISVAESIEFPTAGGLTAHAFYYPPTNPDFAAAAGEKPPLVVKVHGGPTSHSKAELSMGVQYWTSRGFGLLDVNHGGSSGFGRDYRQRLNGNWGVVDVGDVVAAVRYLIVRDALTQTVRLFEAAVRAVSRCWPHWLFTTCSRREPTTTE